MYRFIKNTYCLKNSKSACVIALPFPYIPMKCQKKNLLSLKMHFFVIEVERANSFSNGDVFSSSLFHQSK